MFVVFLVLLISSFNPRPHVRGDVIKAAQALTQKFQSTPPREGRRFALLPSQVAGHVSIHAPT